MPFFKVRNGHQCGHNGQTLDAGTVINISAHLGWECREKLEPCSEEGESLGHLSPSELLVAQAAPHERATLRTQLGVQEPKPKPVPALVGKPTASTTGGGVAPSVHK